MPLLRTEAENRAQVVTVRSYELDLDLTLDPAHGFASRTTIRFDGEPGAATFADIRARSMRSATLNGTPLADPVDGRLALPSLAASNELVVDAVMAYSHDGEGLHRSVDPADGRAYVYAMSFLDAAPRWFACFDQPDLKAPVALTVRCPEGWTVAGNGPATHVGSGTWEIAATHPLATYFTTIVAGPWHTVRREHDGIPLAVHVRQSLAEHLDPDADELFDLTAACFDELHRLFGVRYPWGEYHQAFVPDYNHGAMENPGCVTFDDTLVFRARPTDAERHERANVVAHEMAHMWFGNLVTMRWWDDLWLNESFAEYLGYRVCGAVGHTGTWSDFAIARKSWGYAADRRPSTHPVSGNAAADTASALNEFDGISYAKGAAVLRQLAARVGDDVLLDGLRGHFAAHRFGNATFADLLGALVAAGASGLDDWARRWLRTSGVDTLRVVPTDGGSTIVGGERPHAVQVAAYDATGHELARRRVQVTGMAAVAHPPAALVLADAADETWAKVSIGDWSVVPALLPGLDPTARAVIWNALRLAAADAEVSPGAVLDVLAAVVEDTDMVLTHLLGWAATTVCGTYATDAERAALSARLADIAQRAMDGARPASGRQLAAARGLVAATADVELLRAWLADRAPDGLVIDAEFRWLVLERLAALGHLAEAELAGETDRDRSSAGLVHAARCRALRPDAEAKRAAWRTIMTDPDAPNLELYATAEGFWSPGQDAVTEPYLPRYFEEIVATSRFRSGWALARVAGKSFPWTAVSTRTLDHAAAFLDRDDVPAGVRRAVVDGADDVRRAVAVRAAFPA